MMSCPLSKELCLYPASISSDSILVTLEDDYHGRRRHHRNGHDDQDSGPKKKLKPVPFNDIYHAPDSHPLVGDRSNAYAKTRKKYDELLPKDFDRSLEFVRNLKENQVASDYNVVPIISHESHGSLHKHHDQHHRRIRENNKKVEDEGEEGEKDDEEQQEERIEAELMADEVYDIYNCPDEPPDGYPYAWPILTLLDNWSPDDTDIPEVIFQGVCVFDYEADYDKAMTYRNREVPFVMQNDPEVARSVERWNYPGFMQELLKGIPHRAEYSHNNHFMYHLPSKHKKPKRGLAAKNTPSDYEPPTEYLRMTYLEWLKRANITMDAEDDKAEVNEDPAGPNQDHWYFRLIGCGLTGPDGSCDKGSSEYLFDELPFFQPEDNLYLVKGEAQKGIHCRFGMKGIIAENHFDGSRNSIVVLGGSRRYILAHPDQCESFCLYPNGHPSARHSQVDFSDPDLDSFPDFAEVNANEVIMQPGDVLYLPTYWFHYIVSLELNFQCNTRSGIGHEYDDIIHDCGF
jgi:hypothetical protein